jgi:hypothetical protein
VVNKLLFTNSVPHCVVCSSGCNPEIGTEILCEIHSGKSKGSQMSRSIKSFRVMQLNFKLLIRESILKLQIPPIKLLGD